MPNPVPSIPQPGRGLFVTGTDTGVGKTMVTAALGIALQRLGLKVGVMKPIETGIASQAPRQSHDGALLHLLLAPEDPKELIMPYQFEKPLAPLDAARQANSPIQFEVIANAYSALAARHGYMLVEGVGGVMVPLSEQLDLRDLIKLLQLPCLVVSRTTLGAVNHTRLTLDALRAYGIPVLAIVLNETSPPTDSGDHSIQRISSAKLIRRLCSVPVFGPVPHQDDLKNDWVTGVTFLSRTPAIHDLAARMCSGT